MTMIDAYIGNLKDLNFDFYGGDFSGNIPKKQSPYISFAREIFDILYDLMNRGEKAFEIRRLDWGAIGAKMTKKQLYNFIGDRDNELDEYILGLDDDKEYVLVAFES